VPRRSERGRRGLARRPRPHRSEFPVGYSSAGCSPAGPPSARVRRPSLPHSAFRSTSAARAAHTRCCGTRTRTSWGSEAVQQIPRPFRDSGEDRRALSWPQADLRLHGRAPPPVRAKRPIGSPLVANPRRATSAAMSGGHASARGREFAEDSPLEGDGFEPSVPSCDSPSENS
jgi:hypothetical protein